MEKVTMNQGKWRERKLCGMPSKIEEKNNGMNEKDN